MKMLIGQVSHETNTFSNVKTTEALFKQWEWDHGDKIIERHRGVRDYLGGMIDRAMNLNIEVTPGFSAFTYPSGIITDQTFEAIKQEVRQSIENTGDFDAVCFALHGAGTAESADDIEGEILSMIRKQIGYDKPLVATLDLHGNITDKMVEHADVLLGVNYYPHTDCYERGIEAINVIQSLIKKNLQVTAHLTKLPLIIPTSTTNLDPANSINERCREIESRPGVLDCTFFHGFPYTDNPIMGVSVLTTTINNKDLASQGSKEIASVIWSKRNEFMPTSITPVEGIEIAKQASSHPVVINETSDNPGGGTPGDGTHLLKEMLNQKLSNACFGYIFDPEVVQLAQESGVGNTIKVSLGGKTDNLHGDPLEVDAYVKSLTDGRFKQSSPMWQGSQVDLGPSVRLVVKGIDVVVCSVKSQALDEQIFLLHGIDVNTYNIVALKSSQHFRAAFEQISDQIITVDSPGLSTLDFTSFDYKRIKRPIFPLESNANLV